MYCYHCGKELANEAITCPNCGAPTKNSNLVKQEETVSVVSRGVNIKALSVVGLVLSVIAFISGVIFTALFLGYYRYYSTSVIYTIGESTSLPALVGLSIGVYILILKEKNNKTAKACAICSIVFTAILFVLLFIVCCIIFSGVLRYL